jgi:RNA polymerase-binding transcription factor DksA
MSKEEKTAYSKDELKEFEEIILQKLALAKEELHSLKETLSKKNDSGTDHTSSTSKLLEDGADTLERESLNQLAARQQKFVINLENALIRIKNGTYGICVDSGILLRRSLPKNRFGFSSSSYRGIDFLCTRAFNGC